MTNAQTLKTKIIFLLEQLLTDQEDEITSGIEEGLYKASENVETLQDIEDGKKLLEEFKNYKPEIYLYITGGNLQGISATENMTTEIYDNDNFDASDEEQQAEMGTPEEWDEQIKNLTDKNEIIGIY